ncbi:anti-sigma factor, partial [Mesorhizobium sp.]
PADALSRFTRALDAEAGPVRVPGQSWLAKVFGRVTAMPAGVAWAAAAALLALVLVQSFERPGGKGNDFEVAGAEDDLAKLPFALAKFKPDAKMADIAAFLGQNGLKIASGPTADGVFHLTIPASTAADYDRLVGLVAAQPFADTVIQGRKPADGG